MHWIVCLLLILLTGCQSLPFLDRGEDPSPSIMPLWGRYQECLITTEFIALQQIVEQFERAMLTGPEPPDWMKSWSTHVNRQPLRTVVDPRALGAACTIRAARVMAEQDRIPEARALYERVLAHYSRQDWPYYHELAKRLLAAMSQTDPAVVALRIPAASFHPQ